MKKKALLLFLVIMTLIGVFSLSSCKDKRRVNIDLVGYYDNGTEVVYEYGQKTVRFYINQSSGYDVTDYEKVKIKYKYGESTETKEAHVPDGARGNSELQYFYVIPDSTNIAADSPIYVMSAKGVFTDELAEEDAERQGRLSIFGTILMGVVFLVLGFGTFYFGFSVRDDTRGLVLMVVGELLPVIFNIFVYVRWGTGRGIIISLFCALNIALAVYVMKMLD